MSSYLLGALVAASGLVAMLNCMEGCPILGLTTAFLLPLAIALTLIDAEVRRLPDALTMSMAGVVTCGVIVSAVPAVCDRESECTISREAAYRAVVGAIALAAGYLLLAVLGSGQGMGLGDVKLAISLGAIAAWSGWATWCVALVAPFVLGGVWGLVLLARGRGRAATMPFGPLMMLGTFLGLSV